MMLDTDSDSDLFLYPSEGICILTLSMLGNFYKHSFRNIIWVSNSLDPNQARHFVRPNLGPNCLQRLSADDKIFCNLNSGPDIRFLP